MMRTLVGLIIGIVCCAANGCTPGRGDATIHAHSQLLNPTFCYHYAHGPAPIKFLRVYVYDGSAVWGLQYAPEDSDTRARPFACVTYGKPPPGYRETVPAQPLMPGTFYGARLDHRPLRPYAAELTFIIKSDSSGAPVKLEYHYSGSHDQRIRVITKPLDNRTQKR